MSDLLFFVWVGVSVLLIWPMAQAILADTHYNPTAADWVPAFALATLAAPWWPLAFFPALSWWIWTRFLKSEGQEVHR